VAAGILPAVEGSISPHGPMPDISNAFFARLEARLYVSQDG
jgi:hypothetical protein